MKILLLDDDKALLTSVKNLLCEMGHTVDCCDNAREALSLVEQNGYDVALVDYKMPGENGIWFMRNAKIPRTTKVLLMTAFVNRKVINEMFRLGARGYLIKPFDEDDLAHNLAHHGPQPSALDGD